MTLSADAGDFRGRQRVNRTLMLFLAAWMSGSTLGCSFMFVSGPPDDQRGTRSLTCTTSRGWPIVDTLLASYQLVRTGVALSRSDADYANSQLSRGADIAIGASLLAVTALSAGVGYSAVSKCEEAHALADTWQPPPLPRRVPGPPARALPLPAPPAPAAPAAPMAPPEGQGSEFGS